MPPLAALTLSDVCILTVVAGNPPPGAALPGRQDAYVNYAVDLSRSLDGVGSAVDRVAVVAFLAPSFHAQLASAGWCVRDFSPADGGARGIDMSCYYHPLYNRSEAVAQKRRWILPNNNFRGRRDGTATYYKFLAFSLTEYARVMVVDADVAMLENPDPFLLSYGEDFAPAKIEKRHGHHSMLSARAADEEAAPLEYAGMNTHMMITTPSARDFRQLLWLASEGLYVPFTNTEQDVLEAHFAWSGQAPFPKSGVTCYPPCRSELRASMGAARLLPKQATQADLECYRERYGFGKNMSDGDLRSHYTHTGFQQHHHFLCGDALRDRIAPSSCRVQTTVPTAWLPPPRTNARIPDFREGLACCFDDCAGLRGERGRGLRRRRLR